MLHNVVDGNRYGSITRYSRGRRGRGAGLGDLNAIEFPHYGSLERYSRGSRGARPEFGDLEGVWSSLKSGVKAVGHVGSSIGSTVKKAGSTALHTVEVAGKLPFQAVGAVASSGVRLASGIVKETGKIGGTILAAPVKIALSSVKGVLGGAAKTLGVGGGSSPSATQAAAAEVAAGLAPPGLAPPGDGVSSTSSGLSTSPAGGGSPTFDPAAAQAALDAGASPADAIKAGEAAAAAKAGGIPTWAWYAGAGVGAIALFLVVKKMRRRGGGHTKS